MGDAAQNETLPEGAPTPIITPSDEDPNKDPQPSNDGSGYSAVKAVGVAADRNARHRRAMEDAHSVVDGFCKDPAQAFFGVFDGHGGKAAANFCQESFAKIVEDELCKIPVEERGDERMIELINACFARVDEEVKPVSNVAGACVVISLILKDKDSKRKIYTANCGDARAVLRRGDTAIQLTIDHKTKHEEEAKRIADVGGFIRADRVNGMLAVTRAIGDHCMKQFVISEPHINITELTSEDNMLILACDGVWDILSIDQACEMAAAEPDAAKMARRLLISSIKGGSTDNITAMVICL